MKTEREKLWDDIAAGLRTVSQNPLKYVELADGYIRINKVRVIGKRNGNYCIEIKNHPPSNHPYIYELFRR